MTHQQKAEIAALAAMSGHEIDTSDIPEVPMDWSNARRGVFYRPVKQQITLRLDANIIDWFKLTAPDGKGYQTCINQALREHVQRESAWSVPLGLTFRQKMPISEARTHARLV